jgi:hypothetical protein
MFLMIGNIVRLDYPRYSAQNGTLEHAMCGGRKRRGKEGKWEMERGTNSRLRHTMSYYVHCQIRDNTTPPIVKRDEKQARVHKVGIDGCGNSHS